MKSNTLTVIVLVATASLFIHSLCFFHKINQRIRSLDIALAQEKARNTAFDRAIRSYSLGQIISILSYLKNASDEQIDIDSLGWNIISLDKLLHYDDADMTVLHSILSEIDDRPKLTRLGYIITHNLRHFQEDTERNERHSME